jgi:hypothetical protein
VPATGDVTGAAGPAARSGCAGPRRRRPGRCGWCARTAAFREPRGLLARPGHQGGDGPYPPG